MDFIYFFISYPRKEREKDEDIDFVVPDNDEEKPECVYSDDNYENGIHNYRKIFKAINKSKEKETKYYFEFEIDDTKYIIYFNAPKDTYFIYDVYLESGKSDITIRRKINQNQLGYIQKLKYFKEALEIIKETEKIKELYKETIDLYSKKKGFYFLIELFIEIYEKKDLCLKLMKKFRENKDDEKNMDRKQYLFKDEYVTKFSEILKNANSIISNNKYNSVDFYGIIFCYLNYYDDNFPTLLKNFFDNNSKDLFEILLIYRSHFKNPLQQNLQFFDEFIKYTISKKEVSPDQENSSKKGTNKSKKDSSSKKDSTLKKVSDLQIALSYIKDIETIIEIIDKNKKEIFNKYNADPKNLIVLDKKLKFNEKDKDKDDEKEKTEGSLSETNEEIENSNVQKIQLIQNTPENKSVSETKKPKKKKKNSKIEKVMKEIGEIIDFSKKNNTFLVHFTNDFWKYVLNYYNEPILGNIKICSKLRDIFIKYYKLVEKIFDKKKENETDSINKIKREAKNYYVTDEFAFLINQIIRKVLKKVELSNIEKLSYITTYNPYYKEEKYSENAELDIFDLFDLNDIENDQDFINDFRKMKFEIIFKENISEYIDKIMSKIKTISNFDNIIKLINIKNIEELGKIDKYLNLLNKKYENIIKYKINILTGEELNKAIKVVADIAIINYKCGKKEEKKLKDKEKEKEKDKVKDKGKDKDKDKKKFEFIEKRIKKLDKKIIPLIFIEIMNICIIEEDKKEKEEDNENDGDKKDLELQEEDNKNKGDISPDEEDNDIDFKEIEKYIFKQFVNKLDTDKDIDNIISLIDCLERKSIKGKENNEQKENKNERLNEFLKELITKNIFNKDEFFTKKKNLKIDLLCKLNEKGIIKKKDEPYYENIVTLVNDIRKDLEGEIQKKKLDEFLQNEKNVIDQRLNLIKLILETFDPKEIYNSLTEKIKKINEYIKTLEDIKDNIIIYFKDSQKDIIKDIKNTIKNSQNMKIQYKGGELERLIKETETLKETVEQIKKVKDFLLFNEIYSMNKGENFQNAYSKLEEIHEFLEKKKRK